MIQIELPAFIFNIEVSGWHSELRASDEFVSQKEGRSLISEDFYTERRRKLESLTKTILSEGGVYFIYSASELLYVGRSNNLSRRIKEHLLGRGGATSGHVKEFAHVCGFYCGDIHEQEIYELFSIRKDNPRLNIRTTRTLCDVDLTPRTSHGSTSH